MGTALTLNGLINLLSLLSFSLIGERISQQAIAQLIGDSRYCTYDLMFLSAHACVWLIH
jgi:hypothetical protein